MSVWHLQSTGGVPRGAAGTASVCVDLCAHTALTLSHDSAHVCISLALLQSASWIDAVCFSVHNHVLAVDDLPRSRRPCESECVRPMSVLEFRSVSTRHGRVAVQRAPPVLLTRSIRSIERRACLCRCRDGAVGRGTADERRARVFWGAALPSVPLSRTHDSRARGIDPCTVL